MRKQYRRQVDHERFPHDTNSKAPGEGKYDQEIADALIDHPEGLSAFEVTKATQNSKVIGRAYERLKTFAQNGDVEVQQENGRKRYSLTEQGKETFRRSSEGE